MIDNGVTWVVAADGTRARIFEERRRGGDLRELPDRAMHAGPGDHPAGHSQTATSHQRFNSARHAADEDPAREAEARFLARVGEALDAAAQRKAFDRLVLVAPPTALGLLRSSLTVRLKAMLDGSDAHERTRCDAEEMRGHLRAVRAHA
jgi:protein required for attachment to host cells